MSETQKSTFTKQAAERIVAMLNRADELGGELRDQIQEKMATDARYIKARKAVAKLLGKDWQSPAELAERERAAEAARKAAAAKPATPAAKAAAAAKGFGDPSIKAQIFGKKSCPWTGRAITILERNKVDFDNVDLEEPEHEAKLVPLANETKQHTVPFVYLRGQFIGGFNALAEIERLGQLEYALMTPEEREKVGQHARFEIVPRPNTDEVVPAEGAPGE
ncbi:MAG TPA: glutaredoxin [Kofleriaceae bacterium]|nr:glutaredoxin [Kofleriaceae bacterium]